MALINKDIAKESISHAKKMAWTTFINNGGHENATVFYWIGQLPPQEKSQIKQAMKNYGDMTPEKYSMEDEPCSICGKVTYCIHCDH